MATKNKVLYFIRNLFRKYFHYSNEFVPMLTLGEPLGSCLVIRKTIVPGFDWRDWRFFPDGSWQISFGLFIMYTRKCKV